jgi:threonylcarbamoyladenosine tRNA methylthiotransferase MtaB
MHGFTRNYVKVSTKFDPILVNELKTIQLVDFDSFGDVSIAESTEEILNHHSIQA